MKFDIWKLAESHLVEYGKQEGFCLRKRRRVPDLVDNSITRRRTFEYSHACTHEAKKTILTENRRDRESGMIDCSWHINLSFPKTEYRIKINTIVGKHNHPMNPLIVETAPRFHCLTDEMCEKIKFWTVQERLGMAIQYNLLSTLFPDKKINKKDLSNTIQKYKKQLKPQKNDACQTLADLQFETKWAKLIEEYPVCKQYLTCTLYSCKESWASFAGILQTIYIAIA
ncbi:2923_t:CDS:2, partial [Dentiscutata erythropus]